MDVLRTGCSLLGNMYPEGKDNDVYAISTRLMACFGSILLYWYHYATSRVRVNTAGAPGDTMASHFVRLLKNDGSQVCVSLHSIVLWFFFFWGIHAENLSLVSCSRTLPW